jgi:hypothetical protein
MALDIAIDDFHILRAIDAGRDQSMIFRSAMIGWTV